MVLTKLGHLDLAWSAAERGALAAAETADPTINASLARSVVHVLQSHGRAEAATRHAEATCDRLRAEATPDEGSRALVGTFLLAAAMSAAGRPTSRSTG